jgi:phosphoribosylformylglycinamidine cyclo-ligase
MDYKSSGVDIEAGNAFVARLKEKVSTIGGFGGMFKLPTGYEKPILVSGADGVGTKINLCNITQDYTTIGIDLVAMCVNDVICCGAKPLYFLDYISTPKVDHRVDQIMEGIIKGCEIAGCELIGGETAEHPTSTDIDLAGFCTGIVDEDDTINGKSIEKGDLIIGIQSSGVHSNGFSVINDMIRNGKIKNEEVQDLLTPTTIYSSLVMNLLDEVPILGMAHITGGGICENLPRCIPDGLTANIRYDRYPLDSFKSPDAWHIPDIFYKTVSSGQIIEEEMKNIFNLGIGFCLVVPTEAEIDVHKSIKKQGFNSWTIGQVTT